MRTASWSRDSVILRGFCLSPSGGVLPRLWTVVLSLPERHRVLLWASRCALSDVCWALPGWLPRWSWCAFVCALEPLGHGFRGDVVPFVHAYRGKRHMGVLRRSVDGRKTGRSGRMPRLFRLRPRIEVDVSCPGCALRFEIRFPRPG